MLSSFLFFLKISNKKRIIFFDLCNFTQPLKFFIQMLLYYLIYLGLCAASFKNSNIYHKAKLILPFL